jgi:alcohol dehydrogenase, propanol-preferring
MWAVRFTGDVRASLVDVPVPPLRPGTVRLRVQAAGICHSDVNVLAGAVGRAWRRPFTLGHEVAGVVTEVAADVDAGWQGTVCAVYAPTGCHRCDSCRREAWNYCIERTPSSEAGLGLGGDGGLTEELVVDARRLVPEHGVSAEVAAVLTDAGLTAYHATSLVRPPGPDVAVVVIGIGGLGHLALQLLRHAITSVLVAVDNRPAVEELARQCGADRFCAPDQLPAVLGELVGGGAAAVLDFVGNDATLALAARSLRPDGDLICVGSGGGRLVVGKAEPGLARGMHVHFPSWGSKAELAQVIDLAQRGVVTPSVSVIPLSEAADGIDRLRDGHVVGRLVAVPDGSAS